MVFGFRPESRSSSTGFPNWRRVVLAASLEAPSAAVWGCSCAPSGELVLFRRSYLCRSLCAASGDLCLFLLSRGYRLLCAVCSSFGSRRCVVCVSVAVPLCRRRQLLAGALCRSCSAVLAPRVGALYWHHRLALAESLLCPGRLLSPSFGSSHVPAAMVLQPLFCCRLAWQSRRF
jgi:hypothetical protein